MEKLDIDKLMGNIRKVGLDPIVLNDGNEPTMRLTIVESDGTITESDNFVAIINSENSVQTITCFKGTGLDATNICACLASVLSTYLDRVTGRYE